MPADQAFMDRVHRIECGRTWAPEGVIHGGRRHRPSGMFRARQRTVSLVLFLTISLGVLLAFSKVQPELYSEFMAGDFSAVTGVLEKLPVEDLPLPESVTDA
ncbi:hypothetical protein [Tropicimonas sp. IMCC6043]|uniref:hypothetical protein n=1 Tax=Tropicimonas sp. IMCC6043 TaxID=2510645 RepID=UPI00101D3770|nr:hypothetical protein [Tropicimonas sp. IMCC6043]RYH10521.1 hypothetical protein EU800_07165 [Tropicimonas sp. IMCC6043]